MKRIIFLLFCSTQISVADDDLPSSQAGHRHDRPSHLPRINGFEVLEWLRSQPSLSRLRVVVLTTSDLH